MNPLSRLLAPLALALLAALPAAAQTVLNVNTALTTDDPMYAGLERMKANVEKRTAGKLAIRIYPGSQLGKDEDVLEQARAGANVAVLVDGGRLAPFVKEFGIMGAPYLVDNFDQVLRLTGSPLFKGWVDKLRNAANLQVLSFDWFQGHRHVLTNVAGQDAGRPEGHPDAHARRAGVARDGARDGRDADRHAVVRGVLGAADQGDRRRRSAASRRLRRAPLRGDQGHHQDRAHLPASPASSRRAPGSTSCRPTSRRCCSRRSDAAGKWASEKTIESLADYEKKLREKGVSVVEIDKTPFRNATAGVYATLGYTDLRVEVNKALGK